jgi:hypothetical protein
MWRSAVAAIDGAGSSSSTHQGHAKAIRPTDSLQIGAAGPLIGERLLEFKQRRREALRQGGTLPLGIVGVNRIGMVDLSAAIVHGARAPAGHRPRARPVPRPPCGCRGIRVLVPRTYSVVVTTPLGRRHPPRPTGRRRTPRTGSVTITSGWTAQLVGPKPRAQTISVIEAMSEAMRMRAPCGALPPGVELVPRGPSTADRGIYLGRDVSLLRA